MTGSGNIIVTITAGKAHDAAGNTNLASTSTITPCSTLLIGRLTPARPRTILSSSAGGDSGHLEGPGQFYDLGHSRQYARHHLGRPGRQRQVKIVGNAGNESIEIWQDHAIFKSGAFEVDTANLESIRLRRRRWQPIRPSFTTAPTRRRCLLGGTGLGNHERQLSVDTNVENCTIVATPRETTPVILYVAANSAGKNTFAASPASATLTMPGYANTVLNSPTSRLMSSPAAAIPRPSRFHRQQRFPRLAHRRRVD